MTTFTCYTEHLHLPRLRAAPHTRKWMDETGNQFAYRCIPLVIANASGWEVLNPGKFTATWNGTTGKDAITIQGFGGMVPVSIFGSGIFTFHAHSIFRTSPMWNLWVGGTPNLFKDGVQALTGIVETDWSPFTFTMNWKITRPDVPITFEENEPIGFIFPLRRDNLDGLQPTVKALASDPVLEADYRDWSRSRSNFNVTLQTKPPPLAETWQKNYVRGTKTFDRPGGAGDHRTRVRLNEFKRV